MVLHAAAEQPEPSAEEIARILKNYEKRLARKRLDQQDQTLLDEIENFATTHASAIKRAVEEEKASRRASYRRWLMFPAGVGLLAAILLSFLGMSKWLSFGAHDQALGSALASLVAVLTSGVVSALFAKGAHIRRSDEG